MSYSEEIVKSCLSTHYNDILIEDGINLADIELMSQIIFEDGMISFCFYKESTKKIFNIYISKQSIDETISELRNELLIS